MLNIIPEIYWFLPFIVLLGAITSYQDIKEGKIKNKWIMIAITYSLFYYGMLLLFMFIGKITIKNPTYLIEFGVMALFSLIIGIIIWAVGLWTAGDAKLFFAYSLLIPLSMYKYGYIPYLSSTNLFINTFTPIFVVLTFILLFKTNLKQKIHYLKKAFEPKLILYLLVFLFAFMWIINLFFSLINFQPDYFVAIVLLFLVMVIIEKIIGVNWFVIVAIISVLRLIFDKTALSLPSLQFLFILWISFIILRFFVLYMGFDLLSKHVDIKLLKKGMIPAEKVYIEDGKYKKEGILHFSLISYMQEKTKKRDYLFDSTAEGLTEKDVEKLKKLEDKLGFEHLRVAQTMPFAPYLFIGTLLTLLFQGNLFIKIVSLLF